MQAQTTGGITSFERYVLGRLERGDGDRTVWLRMASQLPGLCGHYRTDRVVLLGDLRAAVQLIATGDLLELIDGEPANMPLYELMREARLCRAATDAAAAGWRDGQDFRSPVVRVHCELVERARLDGESDADVERRLEGEVGR